MKPVREWTLYVNGHPHWTAPTRERCREELRTLRAQCGGKLSVPTTIVGRWSPEPPTVEAAPCSCQILVDGVWRCAGSVRCACYCHRQGY